MRSAFTADSNREATTLSNSCSNNNYLLNPLEHAISLKGLSLLYKQQQRLKHPNFPSNYIPNKKYKDDSANELGNCVLDAITFCGGWATKIYSGGVYDEKLKLFRPSTTKKGTADVHAVFNGLHLSIEIKQNDKQSDEQKEVEYAINAAGGLYKVVHNYKEFADWFFHEVVAKKERGTAL